MRQGHEKEVVICCDEDISRFIGCIAQTHPSWANELQRDWPGKTFPFAVHARLTKLAFENGLQLSAPVSNVVPLPLQTPELSTEITPVREEAIAA